MAKPIQYCKVKKKKKIVTNLFNLGENGKFIIILENRVFFFFLERGVERNKNSGYLQSARYESVPSPRTSHVYIVLFSETIIF